MNRSSGVALFGGKPKLTGAAGGVGPDEKAAELEAAGGVTLDGGGLKMAETIAGETAPQADVPGSPALRGGLGEEGGRPGDVARDAGAGQEAVREQQLAIRIRLGGRELVVGGGQCGVSDNAEPALEAEPIIDLAEGVA
jgi:hypothetical protein